MQAIHLGDRGDAVLQWQAFLSQGHWLRGAPDGIFGPATAEATRRFQTSAGLPPDATVGPRTWQASRLSGPVPATQGFDPPKPSFGAITTEAQRAALWGRYDYVATPQASNPEAIRILGTWQHDNIGQARIPQLTGVPYGWGGASNGNVSFHKKAAPALAALWAAWDEARLLPLVLSFDGAYAPRFQRGTAVLSAHAFGSAFDINAQWNPLSHKPAADGAKGSVVRLVAIANAHGFYWGGHFAQRPDGMHFEVAQL
jgi:peptidoglycan hydrolase-like protein with peptidoglycan-binding domain